MRKPAPALKLCTVSGNRGADQSPASVLLVIIRHRGWLQGHNIYNSCCPALGARPAPSSVTEKGGSGAVDIAQ